MVVFLLYQGIGMSTDLPYGNGAIIKAVAAGIKKNALTSNSCYGQKRTYNINEAKNVFLFQ